MSIGTSITFFLTFHNPKCLPTTFFIPDKKYGVLCDVFYFWTLLQHVQLFSLFKSTNWFFCQQQKYIIKQEVNFRGRKKLK